MLQPASFLMMVAITLHLSQPSSNRITCGRDPLRHLQTIHFQYRESIDLFPSL